MNNLQAEFAADVEAVNHIPAVEKILEVICRTTGMGFAAIARVTKQRWIACAVRDEIQFGLKPGGELKLKTTICYEIEQNGTGVIIDHVATDEIYAKHHTPLMYGFQSYISVPIILKDGKFFGTLCALDPYPADLNNLKIKGMFELFAELIAFNLHSAELLELSEARLKEQQQIAELREQFIAILGHDLRNPIGAILNSAQIMQHLSLDDNSRKIASVIQNASYRIKGLIDNMLDFASGRLGSGIVVYQKENPALENLLQQIVTELQIIWPDSSITANFNLPVPVRCDEGRIAQLFSNLLANALTHGQKGGEILVDAVSDPETFTLSISNAGKKIQDAAMERLFQPFVRGEVEAHKQGLGLGLYIASEIAKAHNGKLSVLSTDEKTVFVLQIPNGNQHTECTDTLND